VNLTDPSGLLAAYGGFDYGSRNLYPGYGAPGQSSGPVPVPSLSAGLVSSWALPAIGVAGAGTRELVAAARKIDPSGSSVGVRQPSETAPSAYARGTLGWLGAFAGSLWEDFGEWRREAAGGIRWLQRDWSGTWEAFEQQKADEAAAKILIDYSVRKGEWSDSLYSAVNRRTLFTDFVGATSMQESYQGRDVYGDLSGMERWQRGLAGGGSVLTLAAPLAPKMTVGQAVRSLGNGVNRTLGSLVRLMEGADDMLGQFAGVRTAVPINRGPLQPGQAGRFGDLVGRIGDDLTAHHMPQAAQGFTSYAEGGAMVLPKAEHALTRTFGTLGRTVRRLEVELPFRQVLARDFRDIRKLFGTKYNQGLRDLYRYYQEKFPELMQKTPPLGGQ